MGGAALMLNTQPEPTAVSSLVSGMSYAIRCLMGQRSVVLVPKERQEMVGIVLMLGHPGQIAAESHVSMGLSVLLCPTGPNNVTPVRMD